MSYRHNAQAFDVALLTIHVDADTVNQFCRAAEGLPWTLVPVAHDSYLGGQRLPPLTQRAIQAEACVAVIDFDHDPELALQTAETLSHSFYDKLAILALSSSGEPELLVRAMRAGCGEFLSKPLDSEEVSEALTRLDHRWSATASRVRKAGKILSFFGAKGGVGTTTLAVHLAMFLVKRCKKKVLLIDNHTQLGHVVLYLGMAGNHHHFYDLVQNVSRLDQELLRGFVATHPTGLEVLASPDVYGGVWRTDADAVERTLEFLSGQYDFVLLDCAASYDDLNLAVVALSTWIYVVATPEIGAIRDLSRYVDGLIQNEQATSKLQVVVNRYSSHEAVTIEQIEKAIHLPIAIKIANNYGQLVHSINTGEPLEANGKSDFSRQITRWADSLGGTDGGAAEAPGTRRFALWK